MGEKGSTPGMPSRVKVICRAGRRLPRVMQDGTRKLITVIEAICASTAAQFILPPMVIYKGAAHYRGWYIELGEGGADAIFAYSPKGYTANELRMAWLQHFDTWTRDRASGKFRLLLVDGHHSHYNLPFCRYAYDRKIILVISWSLYTSPSATRCRSFCSTLKSIWQSGIGLNMRNSHRYSERRFLEVLSPGEEECIH